MRQKACRDRLTVELQALSTQIFLQLAILSYCFEISRAQGTCYTPNFVQYAVYVYFPLFCIRTYATNKTCVGMLYAYIHAYTVLSYNIVYNCFVSDDALT